MHKTPSGGIIICYTNNNVRNHTIIHDTRRVFPQNMLGLIVGNILVLTLGIVDDKYCLNAKLKLLGQLLLAVSMFLGFSD